MSLFGAASGPWDGVAPPAYITGHRYRPNWVATTNTALTTVAAQLYYFPIYIWQTRSFAGASTFNQGVGDNGDTYRIGLYTHSATNGPTTLVKDWGETTLTGAAAERAISSAVSITSVGWYWLAFHANQAADMFRYEGEGLQISAAGYRVVPKTMPFIGQIVPTLAVTTVTVGCSVNTAYGALASTAVTPTTDEAIVPAIWLIP